MNKFQEKCLSRCKRLLLNTHIPFTGPIQVEGKRETYVIVQFSLNEDAAELFIYADEAGVMINAKNWTIFEAPDFDHEDILIDAYQNHIANLLNEPI